MWGDRNEKRDNIAVKLVNAKVQFGLVVAVENVTLDVPAFQFLVIVGPTSCGKLILLNIAAGLLKLADGYCEIFGEKLQTINKTVGYFFQADSLMPWKTAIDNIAIGLAIRGIARIKNQFSRTLHKRRLNQK